MRYLSLFSGIEAATQAWQPLGWECIAVSEIEPFPCAVLEHHYPNIPNLGDVTKITEQQIKDLGQIDLVVFGSPCQNLSVAGNRKGFAGEQSSLFYAAMEIIKHAKRHCNTRFALWENVPGAFSSNTGADFAAVVAHLAGLNDVKVPENGWGKEGAALGDCGMLEWSVLDAQWFGLAQRRKRVFAIVDFGEWASRPPILLERERLRGNTPPSREARQDIAADVRESTTSESLYIFVEPSRARALDVLTNKDPIPTLQANMGTGGNNMPLLCIKEAIAIQSTVIGRKPENGPQGSGHDKEVCFTLTSADRHAVAYGCLNPEQPQCWRVYETGGVSPALQAGEGRGNAILQPPSVVRRLTPKEAERLQGFPNDFTKIPYRNKYVCLSCAEKFTDKYATGIGTMAPAECPKCGEESEIDADTPNSVRYKALGNSMAVNVMAWIGRRIQASVEYKQK